MASCTSTFKEYHARSLSFVFGARCGDLYCPIHDLAIALKESIDELGRFSRPTGCASLTLAI